MSNPELLEQLRQLSDDEQLEIIQLLTAELAKKKELPLLDNEVAYRLWSPYDYSDAAQKLMSLLEQEKIKLTKSKPKLTLDELWQRVDEAGQDPEQPSLEEISQFVDDVRQELWSNP